MIKKLCLFTGVFPMIHQKQRSTCDIIISQCIKIFNLSANWDYVFIE